MRKLAFFKIKKRRPYSEKDTAVPYYSKSNSSPFPKSGRSVFLQDRKPFYLKGRRSAYL